MKGFATRHIGTDAAAQETMLAAVGMPSLDALVRAAVPDSIQDGAPPAGLPEAAGEHEVLGRLRAIAAKNTVRTSMIGQGYYDTLTPPVIQRNVLENPSWYTAYTPYQPEISQGRLEALLNFQTMVIDLTGLEIAGASMLDEATAAAEAMLLASRATKHRGRRFVVDADTFAQTRAVLETRAAPVGIELVFADLGGGLGDLDLTDVFGALVQLPGASGRVPDRTTLDAVVAAVHDTGGLVVVAADLLAAALVASPGELGADIAVGTTQRFGVPMGFGGPHAGYLSVHKGLERQLPGRLVGVSRDADGAPALRLALQTREQHIRREKATSNICTAQVLLAVMASMYAVYHGPDGIRAIAERVHLRARELSEALRSSGVELSHEHYFDTLELVVPGHAERVRREALEANITVWVVGPDRVRVSVDEATTEETVLLLVAAVRRALDVVDEKALGWSLTEGSALPADMVRTTDYLTHPVFSTHRTETAMMRYLRRLADKDYALDRGMIPLGSCTMKLNAAAEMAAISWPGFARMHPFAPAEDVAGYLELVHELEGWLGAATGYDAVSLQPNAGSQGELAGLLAIKGYHDSRGESARDVCLIPASAHGTNAASAVLAGLRVVVVATDAGGNVDLADLRAKVAEHAQDLACIMITYPSTHGVYEEEVREVCDAVHAAGGQVYIDGANLNALVGHARPGAFGGDVSHLNLHKTFCIPHGGGGPGVGPVAARAHLEPFLPGHPLAQDGQRRAGAVSAAPYGSPSILPISWAYVALMGGEGLRAATGAAVLSANYVAARLEEHYPVLYRGTSGHVAHECILDLRPLRAQTGITVDDVAKRLVDFGFHAPTMSFPVAGTLMVEPTESEDLAELDRFCEAMAAIAVEARKVADGEWPADDNPLVNAPHTAQMLTGEWDHPYTRAEAVYPVPGTVDGKYWPPVRRVEGAYGDRNLVCACPPVGAYGTAS
ncbi:aminomethyl-transferring glycine dehydrogenase [Georgenia subflava]|uniref:Glycine dehydrogenase (decarboxylating) n=2 Tax=Georgenia subflava TaxID=1622177 RepID=A0A6N7EHZ7_9MICO|nr:aminomethyl-transferring glycine dehydrogenase [Georgenia subflava]MPV37680.1 aminomethyl-transferring glycine dehydrogenase [Georgenia subflava]